MNRRLQRGREVGRRRVFVRMMAQAVTAAHQKHRRRTHGRHHGCVMSGTAEQLRHIWLVGGDGCGESCYERRIESYRIAVVRYFPTPD